MNVTLILTRLSLNKFAFSVIYALSNLLKNFWSGSLPFMLIHAMLLVSES